jgi:hypothetical protein
MKDFAKEEVKIVVRHSGQKFQSKWEGLGETLTNLMDKIHNQMYEKALKSRQEHTKEVNTWE